MPNSRVETILRNTIDGDEYDGPTLSRVEELLKELNELIIEGGGGGGGDSYTKAQIDAMIAEIEDQIDDADTLIDTLEGMITSLSSNVYTKTEVNNLVSELEQDIDWKEAVDYFTDLAITYPDAEEGWTASVLNADANHEEGVYRYNGTSWVEIYKLTPMATTTIDGLMSKEQVAALNDVVTALDGHTVAKNVPSDAKFTDTVYDDTALSGRVTSVENGLSSLSGTVDTYIEATDEALGDKVDKETGKGLSTEDYTTAEKTKLANLENYDDTDLVLRITEDEEDIEELQNRTKNLQGDTVYPYAPEIEIEDALGVNAKDVKVKITAQQDLHGYDKPWAGGAGKNLLPMTVNGLKALNTSGTWNGNEYTYNGVTWTVNCDSGGNVISIKANGTAIENSSFLLQKNITYSDYPDEMILTGCPSGGLATTYFLRVQLQASPYTNIGLDTGSGATFSIPNDDTVYQCFARIGKDTTVTNMIFYPMIRLSTETDDTYEPYSNECPISGWDECEVEQIGKNIWDSNEYYFGYCSNDSNVLRGSATAKSAIIPCKPNTTYTVYKPIGNRFRLCYTKEYPATNVPVYGFVDASENDAYSITTGDEAKYIVAFVYTSADVSYTYTWEDVQNSLMVVKGSTVPSIYEPYKGKTYTIQLGDTIYGGVINVTTGVMTVTYGIKDLGTMSWTQHTSGVFYSNTFSQANKGLIDLVCDSYKYDKSINYMLNQYSSYDDHQLYRNNDSYFFFIKDTNYTNADDLKNSLSEVYVVYELATPFTIQLTPQQIRLLDGYNYLAADTGDIQVSTTDINGAIGQADKLIEANTQAIREIDSFDNSIFGPVENGTTASKAYAQGDYFVKDKKICKALTSIAEGATFTLDTNYAAYTLAEILKAIENA